MQVIRLGVQILTPLDTARNGGEKIVTDGAKFNFRGYRGLYYKTFYGLNKFCTVIRLSVTSVKYLRAKLRAYA
jgi:hypothetical protein